MQRHLKLVAVTAVAAAVLAACGGGNDADVPAPVLTGDTAAITASGRIVTFNRAAPASLISDLPLLGLANGEQLIGIDVRPATGQLYAVSNNARIYTLDAATGVATFRVALASDPASPTPLAGLTGTRFGLDFNPVPDRLRIVSDSGLNLRINVDSGATLVDGAINGAAASISASAYTNSFAGTSTTQLFNLDCGAGLRYLQNPPNNGTLANPVALGVNCTAANGFDIDPRNNTGFAALEVGGTTRLYTVSLAAGGGATAVGPIGSGAAITGLALLNPPANPVAYVLTANNTIARLDLSGQTPLGTSAPVSGLAPGETLVGMDFRPANGLLYGLTSTARLLTINPDTGASTLAAVLNADPADTSAPYSGLDGTLFTVDFNPVPDRLRVISNTGQSLRINVANGVTITDGNINRAPVPPATTGAAATVVGGAYANNFAGTTTTTLFDIDADSDMLAIQNPPNDGTLVNVGALGLNVTGQSAIDIAGGDNGLALGALRAGSSGPFSLYNINLATGAATLRGSAPQIGGASGPAIVDISIRY